MIWVTGWCLPAGMLLLAGMTGAQAAESGFYFGASGGRVQQQVDWKLPGPIFIASWDGPVSGFGSLPPGVIIGDINTFPVGTITAESIQVDDGQIGWSFTTGYRLNQYLAFEAGYTDFGKTRLSQHFVISAPPVLFNGAVFESTTRYDVSSQAPSISVIGTLPLGSSWGLYARGGMMFIDQKVEFLGPNGRDQTFGDQVLTIGGGARWAFAQRWAAQVEYQRTDGIEESPFYGENRYEQISLSVLYAL